MREGKAEQRKSDRHHLGRRTAGAQIIERDTQQTQERGEDHLGGPGDSRTQHRGVQCEKKRSNRSRDQRQTRTAK